MIGQRTMTVRTHILLKIVAEIFGAFAGGLLFFVCLLRFDFSPPSASALFLALVLLGFAIPSTLFMLVIPAKCPQCRGSAFFRPTRPISYRCRLGHTARTKWSQVPDQETHGERNS